MAEKVGEIYYEVSLDTQELLNKNKEVNRQLNVTKSSLDGLDAQLTKTAAAAKALFAGLGVLAIIDKADEWGQYASRIKMATQSTEEYNEVQARMLQSANQTFRSISETRESFIQLSPVLREMGLNLGQSLDTIDAFSGLLVTNAANAEKARGAQDAFAKSLQKGKIDADAWMSIYSTMDSIVDVIAASSGKTGEDIRRLGAEGKLSVEMLVKALLDGNSKISADVKKMPTTFKDALQNLNNGFGEYIGRSNEAYGITKTLVSALGLVGQHFEILADAAIAAAAAGLTVYGGKAAWAALQAIKLAQEAAASDAIITAGAAKAAAAAKATAAAELERARAAVIKAEAEVAADRMVQESNLARLRTAQAQLAAENQLEIQRMRAQINEIGRQKAATRMAEIRLAEVAIARQVEAAEKSLAATTVASSKAVQMAYAQRTAAVEAYGATSVVSNQAAAAAEKAAASTSLFGRAGGALLTALGGPTGIAVTVGLAAASILLFGNRASEAVPKVDELTASVNKLTDAQLENRRNQASDAIGQLTKKAREASSSVSALERDQAALNKQFQEGRGGITVDGLNNVNRSLTEARANADAAVKELQEMINADYKLAEAQKQRTNAASKVTGITRKDPEVQKRLAAMRDEFELAKLTGAAKARLQAIQKLGENASSEERAEAERLATAIYNVEEARKKAGESAKSAGSANSYMAGLESAVADGWRRIEITEAQALAEAEQKLKKGELSAQQFEHAKTLIRQKSAQEREEIAKQEAATEERNSRAVAQQRIDETKSEEAAITLIREEAIRQASDGYKSGTLTFQEAEAQKTKALRDEEERRAQLRRDRQQTEINTLQIRFDTTGSAEDERALSIAHAQAQMDAVSEMQARDIENTQLYADQKKSIIEKLNTDLLEIQASSNTAQFSLIQRSAGDITSLLQRAGKERTALAKAAFLAERALAVATILINTEVAAAKAGAQLGIFGIPMAALIRATGYASAAATGAIAVADVAGGRQYGGPTEAGKFYRVNETGQPEMYVGSNGSQYMLPTKSGKVVAADEVSGQGVQWNVIVNNNAQGTVATAKVDQQAKTVEIAVNEVARQLRENEGPVWQGARAGTNIASRL